MENRQTVREELEGKTEMTPENENNLFEKLEEIERDGSVVGPLSKADWIGIAASFLVLGIFPLVYYAFKLL